MYVYIIYLRRSRRYPTYFSAGRDNIMSKILAMAHHRLILRADGANLFDSLFIEYPNK